MNNMVTTIHRLKKQEYFRPEECEERGLSPSSDLVVSSMQQEITKYLDVYLEWIESELSQVEIFNQLQNYYNKFSSLNRNKFDSEEIEFIYDEFSLIPQEIGIDDRGLDV